MSGLFADGFDYLPTGQSNATVERLLNAAGWFLNRQGNSFPSVAAPGRFGFGKCLEISGFTSVATGGYQVVRPIDPEAGTVVANGFVGFALYCPTVVTPALWPWIGVYDAVSDAPQMTVHFGPNGVMRAYRGYPDNGTLLGTTAAGAYLMDTWLRGEIGCKPAAAGGTFELRINTVPKINLIAANTRNTGVTGFDAVACGCRSQGGAGGNFSFRVDDLTVNDDQGGVADTFLGNVRVKTQFAAGVGALSQFTPTGAGANWQAALNTLLDDTLYNGAATVGLQDLYALEAILGAEAVHFFQMRAAVRQTDATQRTERNAIKMGGVTATGRDHFLNQTYSHWLDIRHTSPATGLGVIGTDLNAAQAGPLVQA